MTSPPLCASSSNSRMAIPVQAYSRIVLGMSASVGDRPVPRLFEERQADGVVGRVARRGACCLGCTGQAGETHGRSRRRERERPRRGKSG